MIAFAANSVLGRVAMISNDGTLIDPATYTLVRIVFGAVALLVVQAIRQRTAAATVSLSWLAGGSHRAALMLTMYAVAFSFAYVKLDAATGTLILFAFVQLTMVGIAAANGERPRLLEIAGLVIASLGLVYLLAPSLTNFTVARESLMMMAAGVGWGAYSVLGKVSTDPVQDTARNFAKSVPLVAVASILALAVVPVRVTMTGFVLAGISGAITSGLGYVLWYSVLPKLRSTQAAAAQLSVPIIAAFGGILFAGDSVTSRKVSAGLVILTGIALTINWWKSDSPTVDHSSNS